MFNKYETNNECPSQKASFRNGIIALSVFYGLKIYNKLILSVLYLLLLFYFGCEVRDIRLRWSKDRSAVTRHELFMNYFELTIITIQTLSIFPFLVGGYFLIRHVYRKHTDAEIALVNEKFEDEQRILKKQKREARDYGIEVNDEKKELEEIEKEEEEKEKKEQEKLIRRLGRIERMEKDINEREQKRKNKEDKNRKLRAQKRRERRTVAAEMDEYEKEPDVNAFSVEMSSYGV
uniref:Uncharacterized protein n=1 Tax=Caenorhabditis tropicalis TaxID=1561998 RepID=A0A1I7TST4_9PELO